MAHASSSAGQGPADVCRSRRPSQPIVLTTQRCLSASPAFTRCQAHLHWQESCSAAAAGLSAVRRRWRSGSPACAVPPSMQAAASSQESSSSTNTNTHTSSRFTHEYIDKLEQLGSMMTVATVQQMRASLSGQELAELEQLLQDMNTVAGGWHLDMDPSAADDGALRSTSFSEDMDDYLVQDQPAQSQGAAGYDDAQLPADFNSYLQQYVFVGMGPEQLEECLDTMGRDNMAYIAQLYEELIAFERTPVPDDQLRSKYEELSQRMEAMMSHVLANSEGSSPSQPLPAGVPQQQQQRREASRPQASTGPATNAQQGSRQLAPEAPSSSTTSTPSNGNGSNNTSSSNTSSNGSTSRSWGSSWADAWSSEQRQPKSRGAGRRKPPPQGGGGGAPPASPAPPAGPSHPSSSGATRTAGPSSGSGSAPRNLHNGPSGSSNSSGNNTSGTSNSNGTSSSGTGASGGSSSARLSSAVPAGRLRSQSAGQSPGHSSGMRQVTAAATTTQRQRPLPPVMAAAGAPAAHSGSGSGQRLEWLVRRPIDLTAYSSWRVPATTPEPQPESQGTPRHTTQQHGGVPVSPAAHRHQRDSWQPPAADTAYRQQSAPQAPPRHQQEGGLQSTQADTSPLGPGRQVPISTGAPAAAQGSEAAAAVPGPACRAAGRRAQDPAAPARPATGRGRPPRNRALPAAVTAAVVSGQQAGASRGDEGQADA